MHLQPGPRGARGAEAEQPGSRRRPQVEADGGHVAHDLPLRLLEGEVEAALAAATRGLGHARGEAGLAGPRRARDQGAAAAVEPLAAEHGVEARHAGGDPLAGDPVVQAEGGDREHRDAALVDEERVLVGAVRGAAVLDHAQPARRHLLGDAHVEEDHAVGDVLLEVPPGEGALAALARDHRGDALILEPAEEAPQLGAEDPLVGEGGEERLQGVEHDPLRPDGGDGVPEPDEEPVEIVLAGLLDLAALHLDVIERELPLRRQGVEVEPERGHVPGQLEGALLERDEHPGLAEPRRPVDQELHAEERLAAPGRPADQRGPPSRQAAARYLVEPFDARRRLGEAGERAAGAHLDPDVTRDGHLQQAKERQTVVLLRRPQSRARSLFHGANWRVTSCEVRPSLIRIGALRAKKQDRAWPWAPTSCSAPAGAALRPTAPRAGRRARHRNLEIPRNSSMLVIFAHGTSSLRRGDCAKPSDVRPCAEVTAQSRRTSVPAHGRVVFVQVGTFPRSRDGQQWRRTTVRAQGTVIVAHGAPSLCRGDSTKPSDVRPCARGSRLWAGGRSTLRADHRPCATSRDRCARTVVQSRGAVTNAGGRRVVHAGELPVARSTVPDPTDD